MNAERTAESHTSSVASFPRIPTGAVVLATAGIYLGAAKLGFRMAFVADQVTVVWPPTGIALAAVLLLGRRALAGVALGAFLANATTREAVWTAAAIAGGNTLEAFVGAGLLRRVGFRASLADLRDVIALTLGAAATSTMVSATVGVTALCLAGIQPWTAFGTLWWVWWLGDAMGALVVAPLLLTWASAWRTGPARFSRPEVATLLASVVVVSWFAFARRIGSAAEPYPVHYAVFPFVIWAALRLGPAATAAVTVIASGIAIRGTVNGVGIFATGSVHERLMQLQLFMGVVAVTGMLLAAAIAERDRAERRRAIDYAREKAARIDADRARREVEVAKGEAEKAQRAAEAANRAKDQFLALVSHELRTPLSPIVVWARLLRSGELDADDSVRALEAIERNANTQARLIDDLLDVSRIVSGKLRLDDQPVEPAAIVAAALETVQAAVDAKQLRLETTLEATGPVRGDAARLQQVVWNLLSNAVKFTPQGGWIGVRVARIGAGVELVVADSGCGIAAEDLPRIFERFWQGDNGSQRHEGLGLGLALVRHLVELHGGTIDVDSPGRGHGTVFRVELPLGSERRPPASAGGEPAGGAEPPRLAGVRVLVVDDEPDTRTVVGELLASHGAEVRVASSAAQALAVLDDWQPRVLVSDIAMPGEDGYALIARVRARRPERGGNIPAVALTALAGAEHRARILAAGFQVHASKPAGVTELPGVVARLVEPPSDPRGNVRVSVDSDERDA